MSAHPPMPLRTAQGYATKIVEWLAPYCERIEIAGSVRRERPFCNDIDVVCIPHMVSDPDLFDGAPTKRNLLWEFLGNHVSLGQAEWISGSDKPGKMAILQLKKCQLDIWFADQYNFASRFLCRTGSKEHNVWLCQRAIEQGMKWESSEGLSRAGKIIPAKSEIDIYIALGVKFIEPKHREQSWIHKNLEFGL